MGLFRLILLFLLCYFLFKFLFRQKLTPSGTQESSKKILDTMIACPACGVYNPQKQAYAKDRKYFCSEECFKKTCKGNS
ncbi:MAG TPA: hypothetical protein DDW49_05240 [Deltaproteobacteria bacterium]|nr:MAG: hypothetical protein A2048_04490 [Deltaproteobacteria bacterium GWA2_45_12]HBF12781.1 hypothetical protein [Deltaproteobacteria bacterium]